MKITRDIIIDLLPLYLANEASEDSRAVVEQFLANDPALAKLVEKTNQDQWDVEVPVPLNKEHEMKSFEKTKRLLVQQKIFLALAIATTLLIGAFRFDSAGVQWLWLYSPQIAWTLVIAAAIFWTAYLNVAYQLNRKE